MHFATPLTEETWLNAYRGGTYTTLCTPDMFATQNLKWTSPTIPNAADDDIPSNLYVTGASSFFPGLTGAMYGGCLTTCNILGYYQTAILGYRILHHMTKRIQEDNPKLTYIQAFRIAIHKFINE